MNRQALIRRAETITPANAAGVAIAVVGIQLALAIGIGTVFTVSTADALPACQYEDGNESGQPCMWTDPDTGTAFYVDSSNYR